MMKLTRCLHNTNFNRFKIKALKHDDGAKSLWMMIFFLLKKKKKDQFVLQFAIRLALNMKLYNK